jgi:hypothetical protein
MPKQKTKRRFALVEKEILYSKAWTMLTHSERVIYLHLKGEFTGINDNNLRLPYLKKMKEIMGRKCFYSGIKHLDEIGFIDCLSAGQKTKFVNGCPKTPESVYKLSERWRIYGKSPNEHVRDKTNGTQSSLFNEYCGRIEDETEP